MCQVESENKILHKFIDMTSDDNLMPEQKTGELLEMEGKLKILSESKLTAIISFTCESNIWYGGYSQIGSSQTLDKHTVWNGGFDRAIEI